MSEITITVKTLSGTSFELKVDPSATVATTKALIEKEKGMEANRQRLIFAGKVLKDDATLADSNVKERDFLVCMLSKAKAKPAAAAAAPAPAPAPAAAAPAPAPAAAAPAPASTATPAAADATSTPAADATPAAPAAAATAGMPAVSEEAVTNLAAMGFPEEQCRAALVAAFGNADRAVEYLMTGIPEGVPSMAAPAPPAASTAAPSGTPAPAAAATGGADPLAVLRSHPQLSQLQRLVQANPSALPTVLQQIGAASPQLLELINSNREAFVALMNEPPAEGGAAPMADIGGGGGDAGGMPGMPGGMDPRRLAAMITSMTEEQRAAMAASMGVPPEMLTQIAGMMASGQMPPGMGGGGAPGAPPPGTTVIRLTEEENAAVERLMGMGFDRNRVIEAFLACDKNEQLAANFLMDN